MFAYTKLMQAMAAAGVVSATDPYFNLTTLLLPGNGTNGAQNNTFLDSGTANSGSGFTITRNGQTTQGTFSPFSQTGWSNYLASSGRLLFSVNSAFDITQGDFTVEAWVNISSYSAAQHIAWYRNDSPASGWAFRINVTTGYLQLFYTGGSTVTSTSAVPLNSWVHVAACRSGGTCYLFINGTQVGSAAFSNGTTQTTFGFRIGADSGGTENLIGYISNFRLVKSGALYTSSFTPSTTPLTTTVSAGTVSLLTCQSNRFVDNSTANSGSGFAITLEGTTTSVQAFSPFAPTAAYSAATNGGSGYFDGNGDFLNAGSNAAWAFGTGNFTVECWCYLTSFTNNRMIIVQGTTTFGLWVNSSGQPLIDNVNVGALLTSSISMPLNAWTHIAAVRSGTTLAIYVNGASGGTVTNSTNFGQNTLYIGGDGVGYYTAGYLSGVRILKGTAQYTAAFTPPTSPPTNITNTSLLLNFTNAGITDATAKNDLETVGGAQISTTQSKFGGSSMYFDGTGDRLTTRFVPPQDLSGGNWTIEFWMNLGASVPTTFRSIAGASNGGGSVPKWILILNANTSYTYQANRLMFATYNGADRQLNVGFTWATNTWYHIAIVCSSGTTSIYIDGVSQGSMAYNIGSGITNGIVIGADGETYSEFTGYIDDFRVTKGYARYTANFTPPAAAFALQ